MDLSTIAMVLGLLVCVRVAIVPAIRILISERPLPHDGSEGEDDGGPGRSHEPWLRPGPDGPAWWPEFEREFAAYVALRD